jgi:7,8-dihydropterin-6-yl-methyl-4-(beta-D-ribofuranosyl)aminobenzene 5'-phosphate synthase
VISGFKRLGVQKVAPCHCSGEQALGLFGEAFGANFIRTGVGTVLVVERAD